MLGGKVVHDLAVGARLSFEATEKILFSQEEMNPLIGIRPRLEHQYPFCIEKKKSFWYYCAHLRRQNETSA